MPITKILKKHQSTFDFVTQYTGSLEGLFEMALLNDIRITAEPEPGTELLIGDLLDLTTVRFYETSGLDIATLYTKPSGFRRPGGIGYMQIGNDFIVS